MTLSYAGFYIVPTQPVHKIPIQDKYLFSSINTSETCNDIQVVLFVHPHIIILILGMLLVVLYERNTLQ